MNNAQNAVFILLTSNCQLICETELNVARTRLIITILLCLHLNRCYINLHAPSPVRVYREEGYSERGEERSSGPLDDSYLSAM